MKKMRVWTIAAAVILAGALLFADENLAKADVAADTVIKEGVYISGIDVGGMTAAEATTAVEAYVAGLQEEWIVLVGPKNTLKYQWKDLGLTAKIEVAVKEAVAVGNTGNVIKRFKAMQDLEKEDYVVDMGLGIDKQLTGNKIHNKRSKIDIKAIDNSVKRVNGKFVYVPGQTGDEVDIVTSVNALDEWVGSVWEISVVEDPKFELTSIVSQPRGTEEELAVIKDLLGSYSTEYKSWSSEGRSQNVETGSEKINGAVLLPGDEFSFYEYVAPFSEENGYALAASYLNGGSVQSYGGGICQAVTTLYNAVLKAELEITQRFAHSMTVGYSALGGDAAISGTYKDLRFVNNTDYPVYIESYCRDGSIFFNVYGVETRPANRTIAFESETLSESDPGNEYTLSDSYAIGTYTVTVGKHMGYVAKYWKIVSVDGVETEKVQINKSTYRASKGKVTIGTAGATDEQLAIIKKALATNDDEHIKEVVEGLVKPVTPEPTPDTETSTPDNGGEETTGSESADNGDDEAVDGETNSNE